MCSWSGKGPGWEGPRRTGTGERLSGSAQHSELSQEWMAQMCDPKVRSESFQGLRQHETSKLLLEGTLAQSSWVSCPSRVLALA